MIELTFMCFSRVSPTKGTENVSKTPIQLAAERNSSEILALLAEYTQSPLIKLLKLIIECEEGKGNSFDVFKKQLQQFSATKVNCLKQFSSRDKMD